jgi:predicted cupin superfamily sugar epimerase
LNQSQSIIAALDLRPHPEGGWYRETWRADAAPGERAAGTAIHFLLEAGQSSHWHRVDADELWLWHAGAPLELRIGAAENGEVRVTTLGGDVLHSEAPQVRVPARAWQAAHAASGWALVSCIVVPGFEFGGFELAAPG